MMVMNAIEQEMSHAKLKISTHNSREGGRMRRRGGDWNNQDNYLIFIDFLSVNFGGVAKINERMSEREMNKNNLRKLILGSL